MADMIRIRWTLPTLRDVTTSSRLAITRAALQAITGMKIDTAKGIDAAGRPFVPYAKKYAAKREASGRNGAPPDLTLTGTMLRALRLLRVESDTRAIIGWEGQHTTRNVLAGFGATRFRQLAQGRVSRLDQTPLRSGEAAFVKRASAQARARVRTVPYIKLVQGLNRRRRFFAIARDERRRKILDVYRKTLSSGLQAAMQRPSARTAVR